MSWDRAESGKLDSQVEASFRDSEEAVDSYQEVPDDQLMPPANFRPFFTLIEDSSTGEHYHPHVHYIFSDDDPDNLTTSLMDNIQAEESNGQRLLLVDIGPDGKSIKSAHSLSDKWQVTQTSLIPAPSWTESGPEATTEGLMMKVEGDATPNGNEAAKRTPDQNDALKHIETDITTFNESLQHLQVVLSKSAMR